MAGDYIEIGDAVKDSPRGAGTVTGITEAGYPQVNGVAVAWLELSVGELYFDPKGVRQVHKAQRAAQASAKEGAAAAMSRKRDIRRARRERDQEKRTPEPRH